MPKMRAKHALSAIQHTLSAREFNADTLDHLTMLLTSAGFPLITIGEDERVRIVLDHDYEPDGDYDLAEEREKLSTGEWTAYDVYVDVKCEHCGHWELYKASLSGIVVETSNADGLYDGEISEIPDEYLRSVACELIVEARG
jgi:hypothetical protein